MTEFISKFVAYVKDLGSGYPQISLGSCSSSSSSSEESLTYDDNYDIVVGCSYLLHPHQTHTTTTRRCLREEDKLINIVGTAPHRHQHSPLSRRWPVHKAKKAVVSHVSMQHRQWPVSVARPDGEELYLLSRSTPHNNNHPRLNVGERIEGEEEDEVRRTYIVPVPNRTVPPSSSRRPLVNSSMSTTPSTFPLIRVPSTATAAPFSSKRRDEIRRKQRDVVVVGQRDIHVVPKTASPDDHSIMMMMMTTNTNIATSETSSNFGQIEPIDQDCQGVGMALDLATQRPDDSKTNDMARLDLRKLLEPQEITVSAQP